MVTQPTVEQRKEQPYLAIHRKVNMKDIPAVLPPLIGEVKAWMKENNMNTDCRPFFLYQSIDNYNNLEAAAGVLIESTKGGNGDIISGSFPAGNYATVLYTGNYSNLIEGHLAVESFIKQNKLKEKQQISGNGIEWGGRTEFYLNSPETEPDPAKWKTEVAFLLEE